MKNNSVLIDSDVLIWWLRGRQDVVKKLSSLLPEIKIITTPVTVAEIWAGARKSEEQIMEELFRNIEVIDIDEQIGKLAGNYIKQYKTSHKIELGDALIAASVSVYKIKLWTFNIKHYPMIEKKGFL